MNLQEVIQNHHYFLTPAFVYDESILQENLELFSKIKDDFDCKLLFAMKSFSIPQALKFMIPYVDGFAASSLFESVLARHVSDKPIHVTCPGLDLDAFQAINQIANCITFNSISQLKQMEKEATEIECGLRINPKISFVEDERYDPCRKFSKLGVSVKDLDESLNIKGIHFHTNCESSEFSQLLTIIHYLDEEIPNILEKIEWINFGGGYFPTESEDLENLQNAIKLMQRKYGLEVIIEPGGGISRDVGFIASRVVDMFNSDGKKIAVLDTSINHMPEIFEYGFTPEILNSNPDGEHSYILAGSTCLAGDLFGEHSFDKPLGIGSVVVFSSVGSYSLVKANMFNGINMPTLYRVTLDNELDPLKRYKFKEFYYRCGGTEYEVV